MLLFGGNGAESDVCIFNFLSSRAHKGGRQLRSVRDGISRPNRWFMVDRWDSGHARNTSIHFSAHGLAEKSSANGRESRCFRPENT